MTTASPVSVFGPLVAQGMSVWSAEADAWPLSDAPEDVCAVRELPRPPRPDYRALSRWMDEQLDAYRTELIRRALETCSRCRVRSGHAPTCGYVTGNDSDLRAP